MDQSFPCRCCFNKVCLVFRENLHHCNTLSYVVNCGPLVSSNYWLFSLSWFVEKKKQNNIIFRAFRVKLASRHVKKLNHGWRKFAAHFYFNCTSNARFLHKTFRIVSPWFMIRHFLFEFSDIRNWEWQCPQKIHTRPWVGRIYFVQLSWPKI